MIDDINGKYCGNSSVSCSQLNQVYTRLPYEEYANPLIHYNGVIMNVMAPQIISITIVYSIVYLSADQRKHQISALLAFVRGIHRDRWFPRRSASNAENASTWWRHCDNYSKRQNSSGMEMPACVVTYSNQPTYRNHLKVPVVNFIAPYIKVNNKKNRLKNHRKSYLATPYTSEPSDQYYVRRKFTPASKLMYKHQALH